MWKLGLHYRWTYLELQRRFIEEDAFGRPASLARDRAGRKRDVAPLMAQFSGKLTELGVNDETIPGMEAAYEDLLDALATRARGRFDELVDRAGGTQLMSMRPYRRIAYRDFKYIMS